MDSGFFFVDGEETSSEGVGMNGTPTRMNGDMHHDHTLADQSWILSENDEWSTLQNSARNVSEVLQKLEENVESGYQQLQEKITDLGKEDIEQTEKLLQNFQSRWVEKCKETENLRVSLRRATHESTRVNDDYHDMQESVSKLRKQFGQAIDSSVVEIEELSICNNSLSQRIQNLEAKIRQGDRAFKQKAKDNLTSLNAIIEYSSQDDVTIKSLQTRLKKEADKIDRMIVVENLFDVDTSTRTTSNLADKSQQMVDAISQGLVETLRKELHECRNITENQRNRIKVLEREKEEFLENQLALKHDGVSEMNELIEYLRKSVFKRRVGSNSDGIEATDLKMVKRNIDNVKKLVQNIRDGLDKAFKMVSSKSNEIVELKESVKEMDEQMKTYAVNVENLQEEKHFLNTKLGHLETQHQLTSDELNTIQKHLKQVDSERKSLFDENTELKGGKENMRDFCSNLSGENDKLLHNLKSLQNERDKLFEDLQDQMERVNHCTSANNELERQCENLENVIAKLRREYQDQTREVNILTRENEEFKRTLQDCEQDRLKLRRNVKAVETGNKDLEDQMFQLTSDLQKLKSEHKKLTKSQKESLSTIQDLTNSMANSESEKINLKKELQDILKQQKELQDVNKALSTEVNREKEIADKTRTLLPSYEKLLIKLLHHRKELLSQINPYPNNTSDINLQLTSTQSIDYKNIEDIKLDMENTTEEVNSTYEIISTFVGDMHKNYIRYEEFLKELVECLNVSETNSTNDKSDSCYCSTTESDLFELFLPGRDLTDGRRGLNALKSKSSPPKNVTATKKQCEFPPNLLEKLLDQIKRNLSSCANSDDKNTSVRRKNIKKIQQLQRQLRRRKLSEQSLRSKLSQLKKETNVIKTLHRSYHSKQPTPTPSPKKSLIHSPSNIPDNTETIKSLLEELKRAESEIEQVRQSLNSCSTDELTKEKLKTNFDTIDGSFSRIRDNLVRNTNCQCTCHESIHNSNVDELEKKFSVIKDQRQYMLEHMNFTNKRLEVLLGCLKGRQTNDENNNQLPEPNSSSLNTVPLLKRVRKSFDDDMNAMKKAVSILELTKAISITDLTELDTEKAIDEEHRDVIVLVKDMNNNMESILREARSKLTEAKVSKKKDDQNQNGRILEKSTSEKTRHDGQTVPSTSRELSDEYIPKSELLKTENELKVSLESAQKKVEDLSQFLEKREEELRERDKTIAKLNEDYKQLKLKSSDKNDRNIQTRDCMIEEYAKSKKKLEQENQFLQVVVKELRDELLTFQASFKKEETNQQHLQEFINELTLCKTSLEKSLDKVAYELNIVKKDRDHLMRTLHSINSYDSYQWYGNEHYHPNIGEHAYNDPYFQQECSMCVFPDYPESTTTFPISEDDWVSFCDDYESYPSDGEQDVVSSSESATTSSRVAKNISTLEASESIKSKNRPQKYLKQETRTRKPLVSPKISARTPRHHQCESHDGVSMAGGNPSSQGDYRVQGRREQSIHRTPRSPALSSRQRGSSIDSSHAVPTHRTNTSRPSSRTSSRPQSGNYEVPHSYHQQPIIDNDVVHTTSSRTQDEYYEDRRLSARSPRDQLAAPFLNQTFEKKKKKKFLPFGKK